MTHLFRHTSRAVLTMLCLLMVLSVQAQNLPLCEQRPGYHGLPRANPRYYCYEEVVSVTDKGEMPFTALAFAPDSRLFAARPLQGEIWMLHDTDGDFQPDTPEIVAQGLTLPNALVYHDGALYIAAANAIYRLSDGGTLETLVDDLPAGAGFWTGGLAVGDDDRIYVGIGAPCDFCVWDDPTRGVILSFAPDGRDRQIVARGFRHPAGLAFWRGDLYVSDSAPNMLAALNGQDEINRIVPGANYGFPYCSGTNNEPTALAGTFDCSSTVPPTMTLPTQSLPVTLAAYDSDTFPNLTGKLLMALAGSSGRADIQGYAIQVVDLTRLDVQDNGAETLLPYDNIVTDGLPPVYLPEQGLQDWGAVWLNQRGAGVFPHRIYGMAISPQGWIYFSVGGGKIASLRTNLLPK